MKKKKKKKYVEKLINFRKSMTLTEIPRKYVLIREKNLTFELTGKMLNTL